MFKKGKPNLMQKTLSAAQIKDFYHDNFAKDQVADFLKFFGKNVADELKQVIDIGGGCGFFAQYLQKLTDYKVMVLEMDPISVQACHDAGICAVQGDALNPKIDRNCHIVAFNLILHHLVAGTNHETLTLQRRALLVWKPQVNAIFVNEYIYESYLPGFSGWLIYIITKSPLLSLIGSVISKVIPSLRANTFGVGVRFRSREEWIRVFDSAGYIVKSSSLGQSEHVSFARKFLLIRQIRRDSFLLIPRSAQ
jgi:hypothetical protein